MSSKELYLSAGNYKIFNSPENESIGHGSFSKVKLAQHLPTGEWVACKIYRLIPSLSFRKNIDLIRTEVNIWRQLRHENICQLLEVMVVDSTRGTEMCIETSDWKSISANVKILAFMELLEGGDVLEHVTKYGCFNENTAARLFRQLCSACRYLHVGKKIAHRDLKLENLMLDSTRKNLKLVDFGFAKTFGLHKNEDRRPVHKTKFFDTHCGSVAYSAPEVLLASESYNGEQADLWSLGVIAYCLVYGQLPFDDEQESVMVSKILRAEFRLPELNSSGNLVSAEAKDLVNCLLMLEPSSRLSIDEVLNHKWLSISEHIGTKFETKESDSDVDSFYSAVEELSQRESHFDINTLHNSTGIHIIPTESFGQQELIEDYIMRLKFEEKVILYNLIESGHNCSHIVWSLKNCQPNSIFALFSLLCRLPCNLPSPQDEDQLAQNLIGKYMESHDQDISTQPKGFNFTMVKSNQLKENASSHSLPVNTPMLSSPRHMRRELLSESLPDGFSGGYSSNSGINLSDSQTQSNTLRRSLGLKSYQPRTILEEEDD